MSIAGAFVELLKLLDGDLYFYESPGGGGEEFIDYNEEEWKLVKRALSTLKILGFKSFRDFSEQLVSKTCERYMERMLNATGLCRLPLHVSFNFPLEIIVPQAEFDALEAAFKIEYKNCELLEGALAFFRNHGIDAVYTDRRAASCHWNCTVNEGRVTGHADPERFWVDVTKYIKVVRP